MTFEFKSNIDEVILSLQKKDLVTKKLIKNVMVEQMEEFRDDVIEDEMSGRKGNRGLNVKTGHLKGGWRIRTRISANDVLVKLFTKVVYAAIHQFGGYTGRGHASYIPKRLYVYERWGKGWADNIKFKLVEAYRRGFKK